MTETATPPADTAQPNEQPAQPRGTDGKFAPNNEGGEPSWKAKFREMGVPEKHIRDSESATVAEVVKAHGSLEKMLGELGTKGKKPEAPADDPKAPKADEKDGEKPEDPAGKTPPGDLTIKPSDPADSVPGVAGLLKRAGLEGQETELGKQWLEKGELSPEQYEAFGKLNLDRESVDVFMAGQAALAKVSEQRVVGFVTQAEKIAGGSEQLETLRNWAAREFDQERLSRLNAAVESDAAFYPEMVQILSAEYAAKHGAKPKSGVVDGGGGGGGGGTKVRTLAEYRDLASKASRARERGNADVALEKKLAGIDVSKLS